MRFADRFAALKQSGGIVKRFAAPLIAVNETDQQGRAPDARMKLIEDLEILRNKTRFEDEVLRRVSGNSQFWGQDQFGASGRETLVSADNLLKIATQIPDGRVNLSKTDLHAAHRRLCATQPPAIPFSSAFSSLSSHRPLFFDIKFRKTFIAAAPKPAFHS